jgi:hypothetical protein
MRASLKGRRQKPIEPKQSRPRPAKKARDFASELVADVFKEARTVTAA